MAAKEKIGILGSGDVAKQLGKGLAKHGYEVRLGSRDPKKLDAWTKEAGAHASAGSFAEAASFGPIVILATHGEGTEAALDLAGPKNFAGKIVIDATNPLAMPTGGGALGLFVGTTDSLGERVQRKLPEARVVKCFNTVSNGKMIDPKFREGPPPMLICGNDARAKQRIDELLREVGWSGALDVGGIDGARWLEAIVPLWVRTGMALRTFDHYFKPVQ